MDLNSIKDFLKRFGSALRNFIRETVKLPWFKTYLLLAIVLTVFFVIITFPYNALITKQIKSLEGKAFKSIVLDGLDFSITGETVVNNAVIVLKSGDEVSLSGIFADFSVFSVLSKNISGDIRSEGIRITSKKFISDFTASANLDLKIIDNKTLPVDGQIKINLNNVMLKVNEIQLPDSMGGLPLKIKPVRITSLIMNSELSKGKISIRTFNVSGRDLKGTVTGEINLSSIFKNSKLELAVSVDGTSKIFDDYREILQSFMKNNRLELKVSGTIARPRADFIKEKS